jgi:hypothetical protein
MEKYCSNLVPDFKGLAASRPGTMELTCCTLQFKFSTRAGADQRCSSNRALPGSQGYRDPGPADCEPLADAIAMVAM